MTRRLTYLLMGLCAAIFLFGVTRAHAGNVTFCNVCSGYTVSKRGDDVLIRCPGVREPWMTFTHCLNPIVQRGAGSLTINCH